MLLQKNILVWALLFFVCSCEENEDQTVGENNTVYLNSVNTLDETVTLFRERGLHPRELLYKIGDISGGYIMREGESIDTAVKTMAEKHREFLTFALEDIDYQLKNNPTASLIQRSKVLEKQLKKVFETPLEINAVRFSKIKNMSASVETRNSRLLGVEGRKFVPLSYSHESWAPYSGTSKVTRGLTFQTFYFNSISDFGSTSTYEHETQIYNRNYANYDNYWSSNLPNAYYDTPFSDTIDNFTIGTAQASSLRINTQYYTHMSLVAGSASTATIRIKGQKGHRYPSSCYSTWCIFADATTSSLITFTAPIYTNLGWTY